MKIMLVSDLQIHNWRKYPETDERGVNLRILDTTNELERLRKLCVKNKVDAFMVLGDIFEARNDLNVSVLNSLYHALWSFAQSGVRVVLLVGNHDRTGVGNEHALEVFKSFCTVIDKPRRLAFEEGNTNIIAIPFHPNGSQVVKAIKELVNEHTALVLLHCAVKSFVMANGKEWGEGISLTDIPEHVTCVMGHYHKWAELRDGGVYYLGSMLHVDKSDEDFEKYFAVYDTESDALTFHATRGPRFVSVELTGTTPAQMEPLRDTVKGNFVTVTAIPEGWTDYGALETLLINNYGARHVDFAFTAPLQEPPLSLRAQANLSPITAVEEYVEDADTHLEKEELKEVGTGIVTEVVDGSDDLDSLELEIEVN